jgi:TRAP-type mannitol/chloroaromatic compound transport system substrate-binding protein
VSNKLFKYSIIVSLCIISMLLVACAQAAAPTTTAAPAATEAQKVYTLKMQGLFAPGEMWRLNKFTDEMTEMTKGRVVIKAFSGGEIVPSVEMYDAVKSGALDGAFNYGGYYADKLPIAGIEGGLPFSYQTPGEDMYVLMWEMGLGDLLKDVYAKQGIAWVGYLHCDPYALTTTKEAHSIDDLRKLKIRAAAKVAKALGNAGIPTVFIPIEEVYTAMSTGTIDGCIYGGAAGYRDMKFDEVAKYYYRPGILCTAPMNVLINKKVWDTFPSDIQAIFTYATSDWSQWNTWNYLKMEFEALKEMEPKGYKVIDLPNETVAALVAAAQPVWDEAAAVDADSAKAVEIFKNWMRLKGTLK